MPIPNFFFREEMARYDFGAQHPLKPVRLHRTIGLLRAESAIEPIRSEPATVPDLLLVHSKEYIDAVKRASELPSLRRTDGDTDNALRGCLYSHGLGSGDNPIFENMHEHSLWYVGGATAAAQVILDGGGLSFNIAGGLHHAQRDRASGFCVYNDPAVMIAILRRKLDRVAYVDIDLHHGDGVQAIFYDDPTVMTVSIHESGESLFPGSGFVREVGTPVPHCVNIPLAAGTTGDVWIEAFTRGALPLLRAFDPGAIVLQMGCDPHFSDPLGHLRVTAQEWLEAVKMIGEFGVPIAACGGGGYDLTNVPRMWAAACMTLAGHPFSDHIPESAQGELGINNYFDFTFPTPRKSGAEVAELRLHELNSEFAP